MRPSRSILLVDDDRDDQFVFLDVMMALDSSIMMNTADDGIHALEKLAELDELPNLILLDLNMPRMDGKKLLKEIKASELYSAVPVIIYSTSSSPHDIKETKELGAIDFIIKPNSYDELMETLSVVIKKYC